MTSPLSLVVLLLIVSCCHGASSVVTRTFTSTRYTILEDYPCNGVEGCGAYAQLTAYETDRPEFPPFGFATFTLINANGVEYSCEFFAEDSSVNVTVGRNGRASGVAVVSAMTLPGSCLLTSDTVTCSGDAEASFTGFTVIPLAKQPVCLSRCKSNERNSLQKVASGAIRVKSVGSTYYGTLSNDIAVTFSIASSSGCPSNLLNGTFTMLLKDSPTLDTFTFERVGATLTRTTGR